MAVPLFVLKVQERLNFCHVLGRTRSRSALPSRDAVVLEDGGITFLRLDQAEHVGEGLRVAGSNALSFAAKVATPTS